MRFWKVQSVLPLDSGIPDDYIMNTTHWTTTEDGESELDNATSIIGRLGTFYNAIDSLFPSETTGIVTHTVYNMEDPTPRTPVEVDNTTFDPEPEGGLPHEV